VSRPGEVAAIGEGLPGGVVPVVDEDILQLLDGGAGDAQVGIPPGAELGQSGRGTRRRCSDCR
jgi:hypothetical protein